MALTSDVGSGGAEFRDHLFEAPLLDRAQSARRELERHPAAFALQPEALHVQVRQEAAALLDVRVGDLVAGARALSGDLADSGHGGVSKGARIRPAKLCAVKSASCASD